MRLVAPCAAIARCAAYTQEAVPITISGRFAIYSHEQPSRGGGGGGNNRRQTLPFPAESERTVTCHYLG